MQSVEMAIRQAMSQSVVQNNLVSQPVNMTSLQAVSRAVGQLAREVVSTSCSVNIHHLGFRVT